MVTLPLTITVPEDGSYHLQAEVYLGTIRGGYGQIRASIVKERNQQVLAERVVGANHTDFRVGTSNPVELLSGEVILFQIWSNNGVVYSGASNGTVLNLNRVRGRSALEITGAAFAHLGNRTSDVVQGLSNFIRQTGVNVNSESLQEGVDGRRPHIITSPNIVERTRIEYEDTVFGYPGIEELRVDNESAEALQEILRISERQMLQSIGLSASALASGDYEDLRTGSATMNQEEYNANLMRILNEYLQLQRLADVGGGQAVRVALNYYSLHKSSIEEAQYLMNRLILNPQSEAPQTNNIANIEIEKPISKKRKVSFFIE